LQDPTNKFLKDLSKILIESSRIVKDPKKDPVVILPKIPARCSSNP